MAISEQNHGRCDVCGEEGILIRSTFRYPIHCECHSPQHFCLIEHHKECIPKEPPYQKVEFRTEDLKNPVPVALDILQKAFVKDMSEGSYYHSWVSNIACCIMDQYSDEEKDHVKANNAAKAFLNLLIAKPDDYKGVRQDG